jgi:hypothetical protein
MDVKIKDKIVCKLLSGRFWLTMMVGVTYVYLACTGILGVQEVMEVTLLVAYAYFQKARTNGENQK